MLDSAAGKSPEARDHSQLAQHDGHLFPAFGGGELHRSSRRERAAWELAVQARRGERPGEGRATVAPERV